MITLQKIKNIAEDIIADDEWVNDLSLIHI